MSIACLLSHPALPHMSVNACVTARTGMKLSFLLITQCTVHLCTLYMHIFGIHVVIVYYCNVEWKIVLPRCISSLSSLINGSDEYTMCDFGRRDVYNELACATLWYSFLLLLFVPYRMGANPPLPLLLCLSHVRVHWWYWYTTTTHASSICLEASFQLGLRFLLFLLVLIGKLNGHVVLSQ